MMLRLAVMILAMCVSASAEAQSYAGMSGLINVPSAEMHASGDFQITGYYLNKKFTPDNLLYDGRQFGTYAFSLSITPFSWIEVGYTMTLLKSRRNLHGEDFAKPGYREKDRYMSLKLNPLREGRWYPAVAIGANDFLGSPSKRHSNGGSGAGYFANYYLALTKHFDPWGQEIGVTLAGRYTPSDGTKKWQGVVGGVTWRPRWVKPLRFIAEWTGNEVNLGADVFLWKHLFAQAALVDCKYFTGGVAFRANLF